jgi:outer membrane protein assembly factor BamB
VAEGLLYLQGEAGTVALAEATPTAYKEISRFEFGRGDYPLWTLPVIANGRLYLRDQSKLVCYKVAKA